MVYSGCPVSQHTHPTNGYSNGFEDEDLLRKFELFDRTRLIGPEWSSAQCWANFAVGRQLRFHETKFAFELDQDDRTVISLSQLDDRYIRGLEGQYYFTLEFRLEKDGQGEILARSSSSYSTTRSVNSEIDLEKGNYSLYLKIKAYDGLPREPVKKAAQKFLKENTTKFIQIAKKYNLAFMKSGLGDEERTTKTLEEVIKAIEEQEQAQKAQGPPSGDEAEAPSSPDGRGMDNVGDMKDQVVVSTEEPVENPTTAQPESKDVPAGDDASSKKDPKDNWDAIATIGLRLLTRKAMVKLSVVGSDKPKGAGRVITSRQSFPVGNMPPVLGSTTDLTDTGNIVMTPETSPGEKDHKLEAEKENAQQEVVSKDDVKDGAKVEEKEEKKVETIESDTPKQDKLPDTQPVPPPVDQTLPAAAQKKLPQPPVPSKRFRFEA